MSATISSKNVIKRNRNGRIPTSNTVGSGGSAFGMAGSGVGTSTSLLTLANTWTQKQAFSAGVDITGDLFILGNMSVSGNIDRYNQTELNIGDTFINLGTAAAVSIDGGIRIYGASSALLSTLKYQISDSRWKLDKGFDVTGSITATTDITATGIVQAATYFKGSSVSAVLGTHSAGTVYLRPNGHTSTTSQSTFTTSKATIGTAMDVSGDTAVSGAISSTDGTSTTTMSFAGISSNNSLGAYLTNTVGDLIIRATASGKSLYLRAGGDANIATVASTGFSVTGTIGASGVISALSGTSTQWNTAYTHSQIAGGNSVHVSTTENTQWDAAYTHSQVTTGNPHSIDLADIGESYASINYWNKSGSDINYATGTVKINKTYSGYGFETNSLIIRNSDQLDNTSVNGISLAFSTSNNYGYSINVIRGTGATGLLDFRHHNLSSAGTSFLTIDGVASAAMNDSAFMKIEGSSDRFSFLSSVATVRSAGILYNSTEGGKFYGYDISGVLKVRLSSNGLSYFNGGNVGIGTATPSKQFVVSNGGAHGLEVWAGSIDFSKTGTQLQSYNRSTPAYHTMGFSASDYVFGIGATSKVTIDTSGNIGSTAHTNGFTGNGWYVDPDGNAYVKNLEVRESLTVFSLEVAKLTVDQGSRLYTNGAQIVAIATNVFYYDNLGYALFAANDILRCQQWNGLNTGDILKYYQLKVVSDATTTDAAALGSDGTYARKVTYTLLAGTGTPAAKDFISRVSGNVLEIGSREGGFIQIANGITATSGAGSSFVPQIRIGNVDGQTFTGGIRAGSGYGIASPYFILDAAGAVIGGWNINATSLYKGTTFVMDYTNAALKLGNAASATSTTASAYLDGTGLFNVAVSATNYLRATASSIEIKSNSFTLSGGTTLYLDTTKLALGTSASALTVAGTSVGTVIDNAGGFLSYGSATDYIRRSGTSLDIKSSTFSLAATNLSIVSGAANVANITIGTGATSAGLNAASSTTTDIAFWAGSTFANRATAPFRVAINGDAVLNNCDIVGRLTMKTDVVTLSAASTDVTIYPNSNSIRLHSSTTGVSRSVNLLMGSGTWVDGFTFSIVSDNDFNALIYSSIDFKIIDNVTGKLVNSSTDCPVLYALLAGNTDLGLFPFKLTFTYYKNNLGHDILILEY